MERTPFLAYAQRIGFEGSQLPRLSQEASRVEERYDLISLALLGLFLSITLTMLVFTFTAKKFWFEYRPLKLSATVERPEQERIKLSKLNQSQKEYLKTKVKYVSEIIKDAKSGKSSDPIVPVSIVLEATRANYDPLLVAAIIKRESTFNNTAVSRVGAKGLMQIMPSTGKYISKIKGFSGYSHSRLNDPEFNIRLGIAYLKYLEKKFNGNMEHVLVAYNWGPANLSRTLRYGGRAPASTIKYARSIMGDHDRWRRDFGIKISALQGPQSKIS